MIISVMHEEGTTDSSKNSHTTNSVSKYSLFAHLHYLLNTMAPLLGFGGLGICGPLGPLGIWASLAAPADWAAPASFGAAFAAAAEAWDAAVCALLALPVEAASVAAFAAAFASAPAKRFKIINK